MKIPVKKSESSQVTPQFYKLPAEIIEFSEDEIEALATNIYDRFLADRGQAPCNSGEFES